MDDIEYLKGEVSSLKNKVAMLAHENEQLREDRKGMLKEISKLYSRVAQVAEEIPGKRAKFIARDNQFDSRNILVRNM